MCNAVTAALLPIRWRRKANNIQKKVNVIYEWPQAQPFPHFKRCNLANCLHPSWHFTQKARHSVKKEVTSSRCCKVMRTGRDGSSQFSINRLNHRSIPEIHLITIFKSSTSKIIIYAGQKLFFLVYWLFVRRTK